MEITQSLSPEHFEEIVVASAINPEVADARGYRTLTGTGPDRDMLRHLGFQPFVYNRDDAYPGLLVPMHGADGEVRGHQFKPANPRTKAKTDGSRVPIKYESPSRAPLVVDVPAFTRDKLTDLRTALWITEGMKKVDALVSQDLAAIGLTGVFNWRNRHGTLGDWEDIPLKGRPVVVCFDSDANGNRNVQLAMSRLGAWLKSRGAEPVHYLVTPAEVEGVPVKGIDDYFAAGGQVQPLASAATSVAPGAGEKDAAFTDAFLVEELAETLEGRFCWAAGLGWLRWNGRTWKEVSDVEPLEAVRQWASDQFDRALQEQRKTPSVNKAGAIAGWRAILGKARLTALRDLARGLIQRDAAEFDGDPDLLTALNGTIHLPSGRLLPFDPEHCITKMAGAEYRPGFRNPVWEKALAAVPEDMITWYQDRLGQAMSGYPVPDHVLVIAHGSGSNGKSVIVSVVRQAFGDYGVMISDRVLLASPDAHPTELMDLRGARYAVLEETPEARHLNVQRLKTVLGTQSIKARRIRQDPVEFLASHSLFINTNYKPVVTETDHGTWRRLALAPYPFTFKKPGQALSGPWDREGDPTLEYAAQDADVRAAALAWMAAGAKAWYARGRMMLPLPKRVERETLEWRSETDLVLGFCNERLTFTKDHFVQTQDMLKAFNEWADDRGHRPWNDRTFASRFAAHDAVRAAKVVQGRFTVGGKQRRGWMNVEIGQPEGIDPWTGEQMDVEIPAPREAGPVGGPELEETGGHTEPEPVTQEIPYDSSCLSDPDGPAGPDRPEPPMCCDQDPCVCWDVNPFAEDAPAPAAEESGRPAATVIGFDLETASAEALFTGEHDGPFVRLCGTTAADTPTPDASLIIDGLNCADVIYGHNILGFDLLALARHCGADFDALAAKAVDTLVLARLEDPPLSKGMPGGYYSLDKVAARKGHQGKTDDIKRLAKEHGGFDKIPLDSREYQDYLRGDLAATKAVYESLTAALEADTGRKLYAEREMKIVALQNRMTLNGWAVDVDGLRVKAAYEEGKRRAAVDVLHQKYGLPLAKPDRLRMKKKSEWPASWQSVKVYDARAQLTDDQMVEQGLAEWVKAEPDKSPWATEQGRAALVAAFAAAGALSYPRTKEGKLALSSDALGDGYFYDPNKRKAVPGMLKVHGDKPAVREIVELLNVATGATSKYAELLEHTTFHGRVHGRIGDAQGSGRWAMVKPSLTNLGKLGEAGQQRSVLIADPGHLLITCDLSQVDLRAMAGLSQDPAYIEILGFHPDGTPRDAHMEMADVYFGERTPETRRKTKAFNHAGNYGQGAKAVSERTGIPLEKCYEIKEAKEKAYPILAAYIEEVRARAATGALLDNGFGRKMRPDPERAHTQGPALMGQGCARDIMCESLLRLVDLAGPRVMPLLRGVVHDEVILSVPEAEVEEWARLLEEAFTWEWRGVPILCEVSKPAFRWSDCK